MPTVDASPISGGVDAQADQLQHPSLSASTGDPSPSDAATAQMPHGGPPTEPELQYLRLEDELRRVLEGVRDEIFMSGGYAVRGVA
jgi:hypothetical protein